MKILVANLGSTSFKYRLFDMADERVLAHGGVERIGSAESRCFVEAGGVREETTVEARDHAVAVRLCLQQLADPKRRCLKDPSELAAIGFKAVHARDVTRRAARRRASVWRRWRRMPTWPRPTIRPTSRPCGCWRRSCREIPLVAAFETGFHESIAAGPAALCRAAGMGREAWHPSLGLSRRQPSLHRRAHGAAARQAGREDHLVSPGRQQFAVCHRGGHIRVANSLGMSPQSGLPHNNRVGDFDPFALPVLMRATGKTLEQLLDDLANRSGLLGLSGLQRPPRHRGGRRDNGGPMSQQALDVFVASVRHYLGAYLLLLNGADAIVFTGGIGENSTRMREAICADLDWFGIASTRGRMPRRRARWRFMPRAAACNCGSCRPTRSLSSPGRRRLCLEK